MIKKIPWWLCKEKFGGNLSRIERMGNEEVEMAPRGHTLKKGHESDQRNGCRWREMWSQGRHYLRQLLKHVCLDLFFPDLRSMNEIGTKIGKHIFFCKKRFHLFSLNCHMLPCEMCGCFLFCSECCIKCHSKYFTS